MSDLSDAFEARMEVIRASKQEYILTCSAPEYSDYSKGCGYLDGLNAAQIAFDEAEAATT